MPDAVKTQVGDKVAAPTEVMANGQTKTVAGVSIETVPMYNLTRGPAAGQLFGCAPEALETFAIPKSMMRGTNVASPAGLKATNPKLK